MLLIKKLYEKKVDGIGLSIFRILYSLVLLAEICQLFYFRHLIFDKVPYVSESEINFAIPIIIWGLSVFFILVGLYTRTATIINYILSLILIGSIKSYEYHMFYIYMGINLLLIFLPLESNLSLDRLLIKLKYSSIRFNYIPSPNITVLSYYVPLLFGIGFVYFDSLFFKLTSHFWRDGLGLWLPTSVPPVTHFPIQYILNIKYLTLLLGYSALVLEAIFLFVFFRKKWRLPIFIVGFGFHIGILICYPIPWFALGMCAIYTLMIPINWWKKIGKIFKNDKKKLIFFYDAECPLCNRTKIIIQHFDIQGRIAFKTVQFNSGNYSTLKNINIDVLLKDIHSIKNDKIYKGIDTYIQVLNAIFYLKPLSWLLSAPIIYHIAKKVYAFIATNRTTERCTEDNCGYTPPQLPPNENKFKILQNITFADTKVGLITISLITLISIQIIVTYNSPLSYNLKNLFNIKETKVNLYLEVISNKVESLSKPLMGITGHGVFMDYHFSNYNHVIAVAYVDNGKEIWLPIIKKNGTTNSYLSGPTWAKWSFRVNGNIIDQSNLENGIRDFTAFWAKKNKIDLANAKFIVKVKKIDVPKNWEKDFLTKQMKKPWKNIGFASWSNSNFSINIPVIETL